MKYVALDIGNVLVHADFTLFVNKLSKQFNMFFEDAKHYMNSSQKLHDLGLTTMRDEIKKLGVKSELLMNELINSWDDSIHPERLILDRLCNLQRNEGLQIALLSNVGPEHAKRMEKILDYQGFIDRCVKYFSCYVGVRKPSSIYYQSFLQLHPEWKGCVYVDDLQENLDASKPFGFRTFQLSLADDLPKGPVRGTAYPFNWAKLEELILA